MNQEPIEAVPPAIPTPRPRGTMGLIGSGFGLIALGFFGLLLIFKPG